MLSQTSPVYVQETKHPASSLLGPWHVVSWSDIVCPPLPHTETHLWPFWPYSMPGACWTVPALHYLFALPSLETCWIPTRKYLLLQILRFGYGLDGIRFRRLLYGDYKLLRPLLVMFLWKLVCENNRPYSIIIFDFPHCADKFLGRQ